MDDEEEPDPEWLDEKLAPAQDEDEERYFKRVIPDEQKLRAHALQTVTPMALNDEDALDDLIQEQMQNEIGSQDSNPMRTGGYSDIDLAFEKKVSQGQQLQ